MKLKIIIFCLLIHFNLSSQELINQPFSTEASSSKNDGRLITELKTVSVDDPVGLMSEFDIRIQWWTLLSEPIEYYDFTWRSTGQYQIDGKIISRAQLEKYPDLLKRFDNLRPYKIAVKVNGKADAGSVSVKRGSLPAEHTILETTQGTAFKKDGQSYDSYTLRGSFSYVIKNNVLLTSRANDLGKGIVSNSPHWNHFLFWGYGNDKYYQKGKKEDAALEKDNKQRFRKTQKISLRAQLYQLEWPMVELEDIATRYDQYEEGIIEPSPLEKVEERNKKEVAQLSEYTKDDFWGEPEIAKKIKTEPFNAKGFSYGGYGIRNSETKEVILKPSNSYIYRIENQKPNNNRKEYLSNFYRKQIKNNKPNAFYQAWSLIDSYGNDMLNEPLYNIYCENDTIYILKVKKLKGKPSREERSRASSRITGDGQKIIMQIRTYDLNLNLLTDKNINSIISWTNY